MSVTLTGVWHRVYKTVFMLNSTEHEIAQKIETAQNKEK